MTLAVSTFSVPGGLERKIEAIAQAGFEAVEFDEADFIGSTLKPGELRKSFEDHGLKIAAFTPFQNLEAADGRPGPATGERLKRKLELMREIGAETFLLDTSIVDREANGEERVPELLEKIAATAEGFDARIACRPLPWAKYTRDAHQTHRLAGEINSPRLGLALDGYFALADGAKPAKFRDLEGGRVFHVRLADAPFFDADIRQFQKQFGMLPGLGNLNLAGFVRVLVKNGYPGPWTVVRPSQAGAITTERSVRDCYRALVNLIDEASQREPELKARPEGLPPRVYASGFEFVEFAADEASGKSLTATLKSLCFRKERQHISKSVELWRQGAINLVVNTENEGLARKVFAENGPSVCDMGLRVKDATLTKKRAAMLGAPKFNRPIGTGELDIPAVKGVGGSVIHFIDEKSNLHRVWDIEFNFAGQAKPVQPAGLRRIDHVAQTMNYDEMQSWLLYYLSTFEMEKSRPVDLMDPSGIVYSQAIESPEGEVRLTLNGAQSSDTFAGLFLADRLDAGFQHIAFSTDDIFETSERLWDSGFERLEIPANYYRNIAGRYALEDSFVQKLSENHILYSENQTGMFFQIYSLPIFENFFFEIVQRKNGYSGYGASNTPVRLAAFTRHLNRKGQDAGGKTKTGRPASVRETECPTAND